jgi:hypothetical protein
MTTLALNRRQVEKLTEIVNHFNEVEWFEIEVDNLSGIGPAISVKFSLFNDTDKDFDTTVDITESSTW